LHLGLERISWIGRRIEKAAEVEAEACPADPAAKQHRDIRKEATDLSV